MVYPFNSDHEMIREVLSGFLQDWYENGKDLNVFISQGKPLIEKLGVVFHMTLVWWVLQ